jgi:hypothetical protein
LNRRRVAWALAIWAVLAVIVYLVGVFVLEHPK